MVKLGRIIRCTVKYGNKTSTVGKAVIRPCVCKPNISQLTYLVCREGAFRTQVVPKGLTHIHTRTPVLVQGMKEGPRTNPPRCLIRTVMLLWSSTKRKENIACPYLVACLGPLYGIISKELN